MARWTTARAVSGGAVLRSRWVSPIFSPSKETTGRVASWEVMDKGFGEEAVREWGLNVKDETLRGWEEDDERKIEEEKNEIEKDAVVAEEAMLVGEESREKMSGSLSEC